MSAGTAPKKSDYLESLRREIAAKFERVPNAKPKAGLALDQQTEILCNLAFRKMG
jgi:hypothetical protein